MSTRDVGYCGEEKALTEYLRRGYIHVTSNWYCHKMGEIDIILLTPDRGTVVFSEVKYRSNSFCSVPSQAVNAAKQRRMRRIAQIFLTDRREFADMYVRFDVVEITGGEINIIENAF